MSTTARGGVRRVLIAVDFTELCELAIERAYSLIKHDPDAELAAVTVAMPDGTALAIDIDGAMKRVTEDEALKLLDSWVEERLEALGVADSAGPRGLAVYLAVGDPVVEITRVAANIDADLIVMGTHGRQGLRRLILGSVAEGVLRRATCDVLVARKDDLMQSSDDAPTGPEVAERAYRQFAR